MSRVPVIIAIAISIGACTRNVTDNIELGRKTSPGRKIDAVVTEVPTNATVPATYEIFLVPRGAPVRKEALVFHVDKSSPPRVEWTDATTLLIACDGGRVWRFQNFDSLPEADGQFVEISISLACGERGYKAR